MSNIGETPLPVSPQVIAGSPASNYRIATGETHSKDCWPYSSTVEGELPGARIAWTEYQSTRKRDAVYHYLSAVFGDRASLESPAVRQSKIASGAQGNWAPYYDSKP